MMFGLLTRAKLDTLDEGRARALLDAEADRQGWRRFDRRTYKLTRKAGRSVWQCHGRRTPSGPPLRGFGGGIVIDIDATTGDVIRAELHLAR